METLKITIKFIYKLISFGACEKTLNLKYVMISSFAVALTNNQFHSQLIKESSNFVPKASGKICCLFIISKIKQIFYQTV